MKASLLKTIRNPENESRRNRINYKIMTFIVCLVISGFLWFMNILSKKYTEPITFQLQYQHMPQDKKYSPSMSSVTVKITSSGFNILAYKLGLKQPFLAMDASQFKHKDNRYLYFLNSKTHIEKLDEQFGDDIKVVDVAPDTLFLNPTQM